MKEKILAAYKEWKSDCKKRLFYDITDEDRRVANIAAMYSESDLRHATVMKAAYNRLKEEDDFLPKLNRDLPPSAARQNWCITAELSGGNRPLE